MSVGCPAAIPWWRRRRTAAASSASSVVTAPPSPVVTIFRGWNDRQASSPSAPHGVPRYARPERARGVLDEDDVLRHGGLELLPGNRPAEEMDGEHGAGPRRHGLRDELRADEERLGIDVHEHRTCAAELDGVRGRGEGVGGDDHLVAGADAEREEREMDRGGSGRHG